MRDLCFSRSEVRMAADSRDDDRRGQHPNSQKNLIHTGRTSSVVVYGEPIRNRTVTVTDSGWNGIKQYVKEAGFRSTSEFLELLGRGVVPVPEKPE
jgi:hypothetical protein